MVFIIHMDLYDNGSVIVVFFKGVFGNKTDVIEHMVFFFIEIIT